MIRRTAFVIVMTTALIGLSSVALAQNGPGTQAVRKANDTISKLLKQKVAPGSDAEKRLAAKVTQSVRGFLDVDALGKLALVDHWSSLTSAQQSEFLGLLRQLIEKNYIKGLRANVQYKVVYTGEKRRGSDVVVSTEIQTQRRGRPYKIAIDYVLRKSGKGLRTFDVVTDGVGLVENYRAQFNKIIAKRGFDGLIKKMKKKAAKLDK